MPDDRADVAYAWVIDGIPTIFVTDEALDTAWAVASGFTGTHKGLRFPTGLSCGVDLRSGLLTDDTANLEVVDVDGTLAQLFRSSRSDATALVTTIEPGATVPASVANKHVGLERMGASGSSERRRYSCVPGFAIGLKHYGQNEAASNDLGAVPVSDYPVLWAGRRCAVYRVKRVAGSWQSLSAAKRVWWGTLRGQGDYARGRWKFACYGPQSWLAGNLGRGVFEDGLPVRPLVSIDTTDGIGENRMWGALDIVRLSDLTDSKHVYLDYGDAYDASYLVGADSRADVAAAVNSFLGDMVSDTTNGQAYDHNSDGNDLLFSTSDALDGIVVIWKRGDTLADGDSYMVAADAFTYVARLRLRMHETVWRTLGYDVRQQNSDRDPVDNDDQYGQFAPAGELYPGYWVGTFYSAGPEAMRKFEDDDWGDVLDSADGYESPTGRLWPVLYQGGAGALTIGKLQEIELVTANEVLLAGSKSRPLPADPDDASSPYTLTGVGDVTAQALLVLEGPYRRRGDADQQSAVVGYAFELEREREEGRTVQVVRVGYRRNADGTTALGTDGPRLVIYQWYDPRLFGFGYRPIDGTWGTWFSPPQDGEPIRARPLVCWDVRDGSDKISEVLQRVLLTTGTGGSWYSDVGLSTPLYGLDGGAAYFDVGDNDTGGTVPKDAEDATLGLGVPASMVQGPAHWSGVEDAALGPSLRRCKVAAAGIVSGRDLIGRLLAPTGLAMSLSGGKYGLFDAWATPVPSDDALVITPEAYAGRAGQPSSATAQQSLRKWAPIDKLSIKARVDPQTGEYAYEGERAATDAGAAYRADQVRHQIAADYLISPSMPVLGNSWLGDLVVRWRSGFEFWATDNSEVTVSMHLEDAIDVWPGDGVLITDSQLLSSAGAYGVSTAAARVIGRDVDAERERVRLRLLVGDDSALRQYAPAASVTSYDAVNYRLNCDDDWLGDRVSGLDVEGFAEPSWSTEGGNADVEVYQFDGVSWSGGVYGTVTSVSAVAGSCYLQLSGALTGATLYRDTLKIVVLREWANQSAAWVKRWHAPISESDGTHDPASTEGPEFTEL